MSTYTLSGSGTQTLSANVTAAHITINTPSGLAQTGRASPTNYYQVALLRWGDATGFWAPIPVQGGPQWMPVPNGATRVGYNVFGATSLTFVEVINGAPPFGFQNLSQQLDVTLASPANNDLLTFVAADSKWENKPVKLTTANATLGSNVALTPTATFVDVLSVVLAAGTWFITTTFTTFNGGGTGTVYTFKLWDGTTLFATMASIQNFGNQNSNYTMSAIVTLVGSTTVKLTGQAANASERVSSSTDTSGVTLAKATQINAIKVG